MDNRVCVFECGSDGAIKEDPEFCCEGAVTSKFVNGLKKFECDKITPPSGKCENCDAFARSKIFGSFIKSQQCEPRLIALPPQTNTFCWFAFLKLALVPLVLIFTLIFSFNFFQTSKQLNIKNKGISFLAALIIALILAVLVWFLFWLGVILFGVLVIAWIALKVFL